MRRGHWLKGNSRVELPSRMIFVDTETKVNPISSKVDIHTLWFGCAIYIRIRKEKGREWVHEESFSFNTAIDFWDWIVSKALPKTKLYVYAHNWNFDAGILSLADIPNERGWTCTKYINDKPPFILALRKDHTTITFIDTLNYFQSSLKVLGESIGLPKLPFPVDTASQEEWAAYNIRDTVIIKEAILAFRSFVRENDLGNWQNTLAGQAFTAYRHRFMESKILIHDDEKVCGMEREAYYGGRSEPFFLGEVHTKLFYLDVNSMYPSIMAQYELPSKLRDTFGVCTITELTRFLEVSCVVAKVHLKTDEPLYPKRFQGRLIFPLGEFDATLSSPELRYALEHGHILKIHHGARYHKARLFQAYVSTLYGLRKTYEKENNPVFAYACKILLNSLYGKFGQNGQVWETIRQSVETDPMAWVEQEIVGDKPIRYRRRLDVVQRMLKDGESDNSFPAISGHITAHGRMLLWELFQQAGRENVYYTDTDSLVVNENGYNHLIDKIKPDVLGALKVEAIVNHGVFYGSKDYILGKTVKHKGVRITAKKLNDNTWEHETFRTWDWLLSRQHDGFVQVEHSTKTLHRVLRKGTHTVSGWVRPYNIPSDLMVD